MKKDKIQAIDFHRKEIRKHKEAIKLLEGTTTSYALPRHVAFQFISNGFVLCQEKESRFKHDSHVTYLYKGRSRCEKCFKRKYGKTKTVELKMVTDKGDILESEG